MGQVGGGIAYSPVQLHGRCEVVTDDTSIALCGDESAFSSITMIRMIVDYCTTTEASKPRQKASGCLFGAWGLGLCVAAWC